MKSVNPKYLIALAAVLFLVVVLKSLNPNQKYSTENYWKSASLESVNEVPDEALEPGNKNGSVLMWASMASDNPEIITALVHRGADVNESDIFFSGTPLSAAAGHNNNTLIIDELVRLGADINKIVADNENALMVAARHNKNKGIIERILFYGADPNHRNWLGETAFDIATKNNNITAANILRDVTTVSTEKQNIYSRFKYQEFIEAEHSLIIITSITACIIVALTWVLFFYITFKKINSKIVPSVKDEVEERKAIIMLSLIFWPSALIYGNRFLKRPETAKTGRTCILIALTTFTVSLALSITLTISSAVYLPQILTFLTEQNFI